MEFKYRANPYIRDNTSTQKIMLRLLIGLVVVYAFGLYKAFTLGSQYLVNTIVLLVVSLVATLATEAIWAVCMKKNVLKYIKNSFGWITALILVLAVPCDTHPYAIGVATIIAILFGKLVFGGFGQNIFNPAGVGRAVIISSFATMKIAEVADVATGATPTSTLASAGWLMSKADFATYLSDFGGLSNILFGVYNGAIGETSTLLLIAVGIYLAVTNVIDWRIPVTYVGVIFVGSTLLGILNGAGIEFAIAFTGIGGVLFGGIFMLTDPVTNPTTRTGKIIYAGIAAIITVLIRLFANLPEGVVFSILIVNMLAPVIDKYTDGKQLEHVKQYNIVVPAVIVVLVGCIVACGAGLRINSYKSIHALPEFDHGASVKISEDNGDNSLKQSLQEYEIKGVEGNVYDITAKGFNYEGAKNRFHVTVEDGKITAMELIKFNDTAGIGDVISNLGFLGQFVGKGIDDEIDVYAGATLSSYSAVVAARRALEEAGK